MMIPSAAKRITSVRKGKGTVTGTQTVPMALFVEKTIAEMDLVKTAVKNHQQEVRKRYPQL